MRCEYRESNLYRCHRFAMISQVREIGLLNNDTDTEKQNSSLLSQPEYGCDYPGPPPPFFQLPPPPRPPFLAIVPNCLENINMTKNKGCDIMTVINAKYYGNANTTSTTVTLLVVCFALSLAGVFVVFALTRKSVHSLSFSN